MNKADLRQIIKEEIKNIVESKEIGDLKNIDSYNFYKISPSQWGFDTDFGDGDVNFNEFDPKQFENFKVKHNDYDYSQPIYNVNYSIRDISWNNVTSQIEKSNYKELMKIINTISKIIKDFIESNSPYSLLIFGDDKMKSDAISDKQKNSLYSAISKNKLPSNYRISKGIIKDPGVNLEGYVIFRNK